MSRAAIASSKSSGSIRVRRPKAIKAATVGRPAEFIEPMKALGVREIPSGDWRCEIKFDGYRALATIHGRNIELWSRNRKPLTADYPEIVAELNQLRLHDAVLDGEIVALDESGRSRFQLLQGRATSAERPRIVYYVFDLLQLNGKRCLTETIEQRRQKLERVFQHATAARLRLSPVFAVAPAVLLDEARRQGLEGIVVKASGSPYEPGQRTGAWLKCRLSNEQEFVIGGFTAPRNSRTHFGAILVGYYQDKQLIYAGKVGTGFDQAQLAVLHRKFTAAKTNGCPFANLPMLRRSRFGQGMGGAEMRRVTWIRPKYVAQIRFSEWTTEGLLRQPVFLGLRKDKPADEVVRESAPHS